MTVVNESLAIINEEIEDQEDKQEDLIDTESVESGDSSEFELQLEIPLDVTEEEHQELREDIENSNMYIDIYNGDSTKTDIWICTCRE
jgi:hypothetical protein